MQAVTPKQPTYDAVVVGSGATGGWMAKLLAEAGMSVCVLEAGPKVTESDFTEHLAPYDLKYRGNTPHIAPDRPVQSLKYACRESNYSWFVNDIDNPYTTAPGTDFQWTRQRILGGRTLSWGRQSYRFGPMDLKPASHDGYGEDWPVSYEDLVPYYERVERYVGICGQSEGLAHLPDSVFQPPMAMMCGEKAFKSAVWSNFKRPVTMGRTAILTQPLNGRSACHYCGPCEHGCVTHSYFSSLWTTLPDAQVTGQATIVPDAVVSHVLMDGGLASGVAYIDRNTRVARDVRAKRVILCASALESVRILLNSAPDGLANSSGALGRYVMDHISGGAGGILPTEERAPWSGPPRRPNALYVPRFRNLDRASTDGMIRGYGYQGGQRPLYDAGSFKRLPGFGLSFKEAARESEWMFGLGSFCESLPRWRNRVTLDPDVRDAWGIPALHTNVKWGDNEYRLLDDSIAQAEEMLRAAGATNIITSRNYNPPGGKTHEVGGARMGTDPRKSVTDDFGRTHDVDNLYVADGGVFVSVACQNPTLTMMALAARTADKIIDEAKRA